MSSSIILIDSKLLAQASEFKLLSMTFLIKKVQAFLSLKSFLFELFILIFLLLGLKYPQLTRDAYEPSMYTKDSKIMKEIQGTRVDRRAQT